MIDGDLKRLMSPDRKPRKAEAVVMDLRETFRDYIAPCPFEPGDLVTPRRDSIYSGAGEPCIVLEILAEPIRVLSAADPREVGSYRFGARLDMRVAFDADGTILPFMTESWMFETWNPDAGRPGGEAEAGR